MRHAGEGRKDIVSFRFQRECGEAFEIACPEDACKELNGVPWRDFVREGEESCVAMGRIAMAAVHFRISSKLL